MFSAPPGSTLHGSGDRGYPVDWIDRGLQERARPRSLYHTAGVARNGYGRWTMDEMG
jgi:hypothetical protein